ncbi:MAG TPA: Cof-type HAD-IIB family hydrolase [Bacillota bacterium]|nr:Cof-type HAD-IIB family hydrolase [Bacillota bacterium]HPZ41143.1 Cof-type HAD-IIB family hydrolase [Bacillota bacterium]HQD52642.1 Cof-type HAD-IIB family hydrolase [Bacillota bacterium]
MKEVSMRYRLLAIDLDETLLNAESKISPRNKQAIREAVKRDVIITISTGRMYLTSIPYVKELALNTDWPMINYQGALIKTTENGRVLYHRPLTHELAVAIAAVAEEEGEEICAYIDERFYINRENRYSIYYRNRYDIPVEIVGRMDLFLEKEGRCPTKMTIFNWDGNFTEVKKILKDGYPGKFTMLKPHPFFLEFTHRQATKGQALCRLAEELDIRREEIISFGDSHNDLDMIQYAGLGVAVANACPEVLAAADLVTAANTEDGVARVIEDYISAGLL